jgi:HrpA-like RNA helicase
MVARTLMWSMWSTDVFLPALNLGDVEQVLQACIEPPARERVHAAMTTLSQMGALEEGTQNLTPLGRVLLSLPIDARLAKMCVFGVLFKCLSP